MRWRSHSTILPISDIHFNDSDTEHVGRRKSRKPPQHRDEAITPLQSECWVPSLFVPQTEQRCVFRTRESRRERAQKATLRRGQTCFLLCVSLACVIHGNEVEVGGVAQVGLHETLPFISPALMDLERGGGWRWLRKWTVEYGGVHRVCGGVRWLSIVGLHHADEHKMRIAPPDKSFQKA